jgi:hypothetical protein
MTDTEEFLAAEAPHVARSTSFSAPVRDVLRARLGSGAS